MFRFHTIFIGLFMLSSGACALSEQTEPKLTAIPGTTAPPTTLPPTNPPESHPGFAPCDLSVQDDVEMLWSNDRIIPAGFFMVSRSFFDFSPQPGLLANAHSTGGLEHSAFPWHIDNEQDGLRFNYVYATTGETAFNGPMLTTHGIDDNWFMRLTYDNNQEEDPLSPKLQVRWLITNQLLFETEPGTRPPQVADNIIPRIFGALTPNGARLVTFTCWPGQESGVFNLFELPSGIKSEDFVVDSHSNCGSGFNQIPMITPNPNGTGALLRDSYAGDVSYVDFEHGIVIEQEIINLEDGTIWEDAPNFLGGATVLDAVIHPDGDLLATVTATGDLMFWSLPDFEAVSAPIEIGVAPINLNSYMPSSVSPLKFSPDGSLIAHMSVEGSIVLRDTETLDVVTELLGPELEVDPEAQDNPHIMFGTNTPLDFAFSRDSSAFAVNFAGSTALYGCQDWGIEGAPSELLVEIDGPKSLSVHEPGTFVATHIGGHHLHGHQFFVNDVAVSKMSTGREFTWVPEKAGTFTVTVVIDDGFNIGEVSMELTVE